MDAYNPIKPNNFSKIDPEPFATISLILAAIGTAASVASFIWQLKEKKRNEGTISLQQKSLVFEFMERFEAKLVNLKSAAAGASTLIKESIAQHFNLGEVGFGFGQVSMFVNSEVLDERYEITTELLNLCRELVDLEINLLRHLRNLKFSFDNETIDMCERFRLKLSQLTVGALSFNKALDEIINAIELGENFINKLQESIAHD
jgi:hypothetical protein